MWLQACRPASDLWQFAVGWPCGQMVDRMNECDIWKRNRGEIVLLGRRHFKISSRNTGLRRGRKRHYNSTKKKKQSISETELPL